MANRAVKAEQQHKVHLWVNFTSMSLAQNGVALTRLLHYFALVHMQSAEIQLDNAVMSDLFLFSILWDHRRKVW